jgi:glycosyltransferase involved in cell wall biosynthesis
VNFTPSELSKEEAKKRLNLNLADRSLVLFVGRLTAQKNLLLWLDVASDILADLPETQFAIAGSGEMEGQLRQIITERGQTHRIHMLGPVGHTRLPDLYAAADIFLLSSHYEGSPRVVLEAAFAGVPTVSTRSGLEDLIEDQKSGFLINLGDREGLVSATKRLLLDSALRAHLGREAQQSCEAQFGLDALAARLARHWAGE